MKTIKILCAEIVKRRVVVDVPVEDEVDINRLTGADLEVLAESEVQAYVAHNSWEEEVQETEYVLGE